ncbi:PRC-barrel domain-containing protein [Candidatus Pacearchaeota archaeon]|nr:PRC-barrel domain-containing protein [Candidatus Pacearchaeota archaeon]
MVREKISVENAGELITSDDILGKEVIDAEGDFIGIAESVFINPKNLDFVGISIDKGFLKKGLMIGKEYVKNITPYAVFLNVRPAYLLKGMDIFDIEGEKVGSVKELILRDNKNQIKKIITSLGMLKKRIEIDAQFIKSIGENVFLNVKKREIIQLMR